MKNFFLFKIRTLFILGIIVVLSLGLWGIKSNTNVFGLTISGALDELKNDDELKNASISFLAIDLKTGEVLGELNPDLAVSPASTMKIITTATALETLGGNFTFETKLLYTGTIDSTSGILTGDIIILGGGDPTLESKFFDNKGIVNKWVDDIKKLGIKHISGYIIADSRIYTDAIVPPTWSWEDMGNYFGAGACGLSFSDNMYKLYYKTGTVGSATEILKMEPEIKNMSFENYVVSANVSEDLSYIFGSPYEYHRYIQGKLPANKAEYIVKGSMPDPAYFTANLLYETLKEQNILCSNPATTYRINKELSQNDSIKKNEFSLIKSPSLSNIIRKLNHSSINLFAEHVLNHIGYVKVGKGETNPASNFVQSYWKSKGMDTSSFSMNDGSGLSLYNKITARQMVFVLDYMKNKSKNYETFYSSLPIAGKSGTVASLCKNTSAQDNMHVKSGSIKDVRAYAGYVKTVSGREVAFAIILNNYNCSDVQSKTKLEKVLTAVADYTN